MVWAGWHDLVNKQVRLSKATLEFQVLQVPAGLKVFKRDTPPIVVIQFNDVGHPQSGVSVSLGVVCVMVNLIVGWILLLLPEKYYQEIF